MQLHLPESDSTIRFASCMSELIPEHNPPSVLLQGELGTGKTTFVRGLVKNLPGGREAAVNSPSFNLLNLYPTHPEVAHIDLYRLSRGEIDEELLEYFFQPSYLAIAEWIDRMPASVWPREYIYITFDFENCGRSAQVLSRCENAKQILDVLAEYTIQDKFHIINNS